jgi:hypothetical protein
MTCAGLRRELAARGMQSPNSGVVRRSFGDCGGSWRRAMTCAGLRLELAARGELKSPDSGAILRFHVKIA